MSDQNNKHPFIILSDLVEKYGKDRLSFDRDKLQDLREQISILMFELSDSVSQAIANCEKADFERKRNYAELIEKHKYDDDGVKNTVAVTESLARIDNQEKEEAFVESIRKKERVKIIMSSTQQILNALSSRINSMN